MQYIKFMNFITDNKIYDFYIVNNDLIWRNRTRSGCA